MHARLSNRLRVLALACSGATVHVTNVVDGCRTIIFSKPFSAGSACRESRWEAPAHWHHKPEHTRGRCSGMPLARTSCADMRSATVLPICAARTRLNSEEEVVIPELHEKAHDGTVKEPRMERRCVETWRASNAG